MALFSRFIDIFQYCFYHQNEINTINHNKNKNFSKKIQKIGFTITILFAKILAVKGRNQ